MEQDADPETAAGSGRSCTRLTASLLENGFHLTETCAMASPGRLDRFVYRTYKDGELSVFICVMTGFSIWILINGYAADQFFVKA